MNEIRNWIVMTGQPVDTTQGGGYEFFGPFTQEEAEEFRHDTLECVQQEAETGAWLVIAIQLLMPKEIREKLGVSYETDKSAV